MSAITLVRRLLNISNILKAGFFFVTVVYPVLLLLLFKYLNTCSTTASQPAASFSKDKIIMAQKCQTQTFV